MKITPRALKNKTDGFTIIEVMIVLAIAGLIILIVFLAVPALQRNSRNTQRRNDAARLSGLVSEYMTNNNGNTPANVAALGTVNYSYYGGATNATAIPTTADTLAYIKGKSCVNNKLSASAGTSRSFAIGFAVETSGKPVGQCI